jgi:hypothetical protein
MFSEIDVIDANMSGFSLLLKPFEHHIFVGTLSELLQDLF